MTAPSHPTPLPSVFSPLAKALLDAFSEAVIVFDPQGKVLYANEQARELGLDLSGMGEPRRAGLGLEDESLEDLDTSDIDLSLDFSPEEETADIIGEE